MPSEGMTDQIPVVSNSSKPGAGVNPNVLVPLVAQTPEKSIVFLGSFERYLKKCNAWLVDGGFILIHASTIFFYLVHFFFRKFFGAWC